MRIAVTGARGQLGAALINEYAGHEITAFSHGDLDVGDEPAVTAALARVEPEIILNAAAFTDVDAAEDHPIEALNSNAFGVRVLARAALAHDATLVHYSTDFVFDGHTSTPYTEDDRPNPQGVYAASKLLGEWFARDAPRAYVLRVESLFGRAPGGGPAKGSAATILNALTTGGSPKVFEDRTITPSYVIDVARATRRLLETRAATGLYHCVNSESCTWVEFAREMARLIGVEPRLIPVRMADTVMRVTRPLFSALSNRKLIAAGVEMPSWQDGLRRYLQGPGDEIAHQISHRE